MSSFILGIVQVWVPEYLAQGLFNIFIYLSVLFRRRNCQNNNYYFKTTFFSNTYLVVVHPLEIVENVFLQDKKNSIVSVSRASGYT